MQYGTALVKFVKYNRKEKKRYEQTAEQTYKKIIQKDPKYAPVHIKLASLYALQRKYEVAHLHYIKAFKQDPKNQETIDALLIHLKKLTDAQNYRLAKKLYGDMLKSDPNNANALNNMGMIAAKLEKNPSIIIDYFMRAGEAGSASAWRNLGSMHLEGTGVTKNINTAILYYEKARKIEPKHANTLRILGALYENTGQDTKAYSIASDWAKTMDPDGILQMAIYAHTGYANAYSPKNASELYELASKHYLLKGKKEKAQEAKILSEIVNYQHSDFFSQRIGKHQKIVQDFRNIQKRLDCLKNIKNLPDRMKYEIRIARATQFINIGEYYSDKNRRATCFDKAFLLLEGLPIHITCGNYNHATLLFEKYLAPKLTLLAQTPYEKIDQKTKVCAEKAHTLYKGVYESLKDKQPHNTFVMKTYLNYGILLKQVFKDHITAKKTFEAGAKAGSVPCMLYLSSYMMKGVKTPKDFDIPIKMLSQALIQAKKDNNKILIKEAEQRLKEIKMLRKKLTPDSIASDACSSSATNLKAK